MAQKQIDTAGKTENFFTRNVKLITFLVCITIIFSPFVVTYIQDTIKARREAERPEMTVEYLSLLAEKGKDLRQRDFSKFDDYREESEMQGMKYAMYRIPIKHKSNIVLSVSFDASMDYVFYLNLINMNTGAELDLLSEADNLEEFLSLLVN